MGKTNKTLVSILVPGIAERTVMYGELMTKLFRQAQGEPVEILSILDNRSLKLAKKRNAMMKLSKGQFIVHLDDDDDVSEDFVTQLVRMALEAPKADVLAYSQQATLDDAGGPFIVRTGLSFENEEAHKIEDRWQDITRKPWHWCAWSRKLALSAKFENTRDEDWQWLRQLTAKAKVEHRTDRVMHFYNFDRAISTFEKPQ